ncbi:stage II sporulation protein R [Clostridia bacterium]|nr:stage II sporulation protein R [Clostridia bacterium]
MSNKRIAFISIIVGLTAAAVFICASAVYALSTQKGIAENVIRFHVLANSDTEQDQNLKLMVRDSVLNYMQGFFTGGESVEEARNIVAENLPAIKETAQKTVIEAGYTYPVNVTLSREFYPTRDYEAASFPAGYYESVRVMIGEATGKNWWCVMFPPLCFLGEGDVVSLKNALTEEEYNLVTNKNSPTYAVKFKIVEIWEKLARRFS